MTTRKKATSKHRTSRHRKARAARMWKAKALAYRDIIRKAEKAVNFLDTMLVLSEADTVDGKQTKGAK